MRLDKFLKVSRIVKRRPVAKEVCASGQVKLNNRVAKAGSEVKPGDVLEIELGRKMLKVRVLEVKDTVPAKEAASLYEIVEEINRPPEDWL
ncbi:ribosomal 50S subunit-recycling heat shock protein [Desulfohalotomaculum tongense]|uniref:RNA-binding S4 domain-containing protein n=1 Tax=Desulforadius tongensis TaxID=1216062 RepID=UPI0019593AD8|nr:RNA-binding S4 domain-containing protein [Desulforadius tongensis]MBM7855976.1 ribosomal 50S subunit-recycling heat shock protein [Desulforadius tongensis]